MKYVLFVLICVPTVHICNPVFRHDWPQGSSEQTLKLSWSLLNTTFHFLNFGGYKDVRVHSMCVCVCVCAVDI